MRLRPRPTMHAQRLVNRFYGWLARHRRLVLAVLVGCAVTLTVRALSPHPPTTEVVTASADLAMGDELTGATSTRAVVRDQLPAGALRNSDLTPGARVSSAVRKGEILTDARVADPRDIPTGKVAMAVQVPEAAAEWLVVGTTVMLYPSGSADWQSEGAARPSPIGPVRVIASSKPTLGVSASGPGPPAVLVTVDAAAAPRLAEASGSGSLWPALMP